MGAAGSEPSSANSVRSAGSVGGSPRTGTGTTASINGAGIEGGAGGAGSGAGAGGGGATGGLGVASAAGEDARAIGVLNKNFCG